MNIDKIEKQTTENIRAKANLIWEIATHLVGLYKPHEYGKVILPMTVLKRFDDILAPTKEAVVTKAEELQAQGMIPALMMAFFLKLPVISSIIKVSSISKNFLQSLIILKKILRIIFTAFQRMFKIY